MRSSSRRATVESKIATQSKLQEAEARRASAKARPAKRVKQLTQDMLIREALETEEGNTESLLYFLEREEERKARQRQSNKKEIQGPFVRWISVGLPQNIWVLRAHEHEARAKAEGASGQPQDAPSQAQGPKAPAGDAAEPAQLEPAQLPKAPADGAAGPVEGSKEATCGSTNTTHQGTAEAAPGPATASQGLEGGPQLPAKGPAEDPAQASVKGPEPSVQPPAQDPLSPVESPPFPAQGPQPPQAPPAPEPAPSAAPVTRVLADLAADAPPSESEVPGDAPGLAEDPIIAGDITGRTILTLQNMEPTTTWVDEFRYLLGDHCTWDRLPIVPSRNRPFRPRQSLCVITGLPARYRDPHTGLPYATTQAYAMLRRVLGGEFLWTGSPHRATALASGCFGSAWTDSGAGHVFS